jgi:hypothetical protein
MPIQKLTPEIITAAIEGFEVQKKRIDAQIVELRQALRGARTEVVVTSETTPRKRRSFSTAARHRMKEAQRRRWAKIRGESEPPGLTPPEPKPKRRISEEGMKRIIAATKKRWAVKRAEAAKAQRAGRKAAPARKKTAVKKAAKTGT